MKSNYTPIWVILAAAAIIGIVAPNAQQAYAPRTCGGCVQFLVLTAQFERDVGQSILEFAAENQPNDYAEFKKLTGQYKTYVINAVLVGSPDTKRILAGLLETYQGKMLDLHLGDISDGQVTKFNPFFPFSDFI